MSENLKIAKVQAKQKRQDFLFDIGRQLVADPLVVGLAALAANEAAYRAGLYDPRDGEPETSELGGPVWITIGSYSPGTNPKVAAAVKKRNLINGFIIGATTAKALGPVLAAGAKSMGDVGKIVSTAAALA